MDLNIGAAFEALIDWLKANFEGFFDAAATVIGSTTEGLEEVLLFLPSWVMILLFTALAWWVASRGVALFTLFGMGILDSYQFTLFGTEIAVGMGFWEIGRAHV